MTTWRFRDADPIAAEHPYTFYKPSRELIAKVSPGENVKLIFDFESDDPDAPGAERMWVIVDKVLDGLEFTGRLDNEPRWIKDLAAGDSIQFRACHIINTEHDDDDNLVERYIKRCYVTNRVLQEGCRAGYLYREEPDREDDSGWRITANDESEDYMDDSKNIAYVSLGAVLSCDDSFRDLLDAAAGSAFMRDENTGQFASAA
jgi:hypothetical protein